MHKPDLVAINANDPQLGQLDVLIRTLRAPDRGAFDGRICVLTTSVSPSVAEFLRAHAVDVFESPLDEFETWPFAKVIGCYESFKESLEYRSLRRFVRRLRLRSHGLSGSVNVVAERLDEWRVTRRTMSLARQPENAEKCMAAFRRYMPKHFSKFPLLRYLRMNERTFGRVMLLDSDIMFQSPVSAIFDRVTSGTCLVEYEKEPIVGNHWIARSNRLAKRFPQHSSLRYGTNAHEVNVGFLCAEADTLVAIMEAWKNLILGSGLEWLFVGHREDFWHEQDFFRLLHDMTPEQFRAAGTRSVYHAVHGAADDVWEAGSLDIQIRTTGERPTLVHFAGGTWRQFSSVARAYGRTVNDVLSGSGSFA